MRQGRRKTEPAADSVIIESFDNSNCAINSKTRKRKTYTKGKAEKYEPYIANAQQEQQDGCTAKKSGKPNTDV